MSRFLFFKYNLFFLADHYCPVISRTQSISYKGLLIATGVDSPTSPALVEALFDRLRPHSRTFQVNALGC